MKRALLVGAGGMGKTWARILAEAAGVLLAGWVDLRPGIAKAAANELQISVEAFETDIDRALLQDIDFVVDVTIPEAHPDVTIKSLEAGKPVLGEKPMATSMADAKRMVLASERTGKLFMVSQSRRYNRNLKAFRDLAVERLGPLGILDADFYIGAHFGGFRDEMESPLILDMAIHTFDAARYISGQDPVSVYAEEFNPAWSWYKGDAAATAIFEMENGLRFNYRGSWCSEGCSTSWEGSWRAIGANGSALWDGDHAPTGEVVSSTEGFQRATTNLTGTPGTQAEGIRGSLEAFLLALDTGAIPHGECHENIRSLAMVFAAIESSRRGCRMPVSW